MEAVRLVYVLRHYPQLSQTFVRNEVAGLRALGHSVEVLSLKRPDTTHVDRGWAGPVEPWPQVSARAGLGALAWWALRHPVRVAGLIAAARTLGWGGHRRLALAEVPVVARRLVRAGAVNAVHTHFAWPVSLEPTVLLARLLGVPSSVTTHARDVYLPAPGLPRALSLLDRMVTVCRYNVARVREDGLWSRDVTVVPCGVDVPEPSPPPPPRATQGCLVVSVGRLVEKKGFALLLDAMALVVAELPGVRLEIIGDGPQRAGLDEQVDRLGLAGHVVLRGAMGHDAVLAAIEAADVFALACTTDAEGDSDAMPVVLREAMARARPVVTTDVAGIGESVDDACGWLVAPGDAAGLARALVEALSDDAERARRGAAARHRVQASATTAVTAAAMAAFFDAVPQEEGR